MSGAPGKAAQTSAPARPRLRDGSAWSEASRDARLLAEVALAAARAGLLEEARPILALLERLEPDHPIAAVTRAVAALSANRPAEAVETLRREAIGKRRGQEAARGILLVALVAAGQREEARRLADEVLTGPDSPARRMAATLRPSLAATTPSSAGIPNAASPAAGGGPASRDASASPMRGVR